MKRWVIWAGILASLLGPANAAGTVPGFSLTPQFDSTGKVMPGCKLYVIQAGTTQTPQNSYQDSALTILQPNPLSCDATGRLPQWFVADGQIKVRLTNSTGVQQFVGDNLLVVGASSGGGGGGGTVDPTTILGTGDVKYKYGTGVLSGFVRANGRTIGSATSGATERANSDAQPLFEYLWNTDPNLAVSTGRGASANADWVANKTIALPDWRSRALAGLGDMGNSDNAMFSGATFTSGGSTTLGSLLGAARRALQVPAHTHTGNTQVQPQNLDHTHVAGQSGGGNSGGGAGITTVNPSGNVNSGGVSGVGPVLQHTHPFTTDSTGLVGAQDTVSPYALVTFYIKL